jgi:hypothetical protein
MTNQPPASTSSTTALASASASALAAPAPRPLDATGPRDAAYPVHALGVRGSAAVAAIQNIIQAPAGLCAQSVLTTMSTVVSSWGEVETIYGSPSIFSLWAFTIAQSGERKSSADKEALAGIRSYEKALRRAYAAELAAIEAADDEKRPHPSLPEILISEPTYEGLLGVAGRGQGFVCLANDDAAGFLRGHAMSRDNRSKMLSGLSQMFSGTPIKRPRAHQRDEYIDGVPLTMHLMFQPKYLSEVFDDEELADQGFLNRVFCCYPKSTMGTRFFKRPAPADRAALQDFAAHCLEILRELAYRRELHLTDDEDSAPVLALDDDAHARLVAWHDELEAGLNDRFLSVRTYAGRCVEHATRLAAVITLFDDINAKAVSLAAAESAVELMSFYLEEYRHLRRMAHAREEVGSARTLGSWLVGRFGAGGDFAPRAISQFGPNALRDTTARDAAMKTLIEHHLIEEVPGKGGKTYRIHQGIAAVIV